MLSLRLALVVILMASAALGQTLEQSYPSGDDLYQRMAGSGYFSTTSNQLVRLDLSHLPSLSTTQSNFFRVEARLLSGSLMIGFMSNGFDRGTGETRPVWVIKRAGSGSVVSVCYATDSEINSCVDIAHPNEDFGEFTPVQVEVFHRADGSVQANLMIGEAPRARYFQTNVPASFFPEMSPFTVYTHAESASRPVQLRNLHVAINKNLFADLSCPTVEELEALWTQYFGEGKGLMYASEFCEAPLIRGVLSVQESARDCAGELVEEAASATFADLSLDAGRYLLQVDPAENDFCSLFNLYFLSEQQPSEEVMEILINLSGCAENFIGQEFCIFLTGVSTCQPDFLQVAPLEGEQVAQEIPLVQLPPIRIDEGLPTQGPSENCQVFLYPVSCAEVMAQGGVLCASGSSFSCEVPIQFSADDALCVSVVTSAEQVDFMVEAMEPVRTTQGSFEELDTLSQSNACGVPTSADLYELAEVSSGWYEASTCNDYTDVGTTLAVFSAPCSSIQENGAAEAINVEFATKITEFRELEELSINNCLAVANSTGRGCAEVSFYSSSTSCVVVIPTSEAAQGDWQLDIYSMPIPKTNRVVMGENQEGEEISTACGNEVTSMGSMHDFSLPPGAYRVSTCGTTEMDTELVVLDGSCDQFRNGEEACVASTLCSQQEEVFLVQDNEIPQQEFALIDNQSGPAVCASSSCEGLGTTMSFSLSANRNVCVMVLSEEAGTYELTLQADFYQDQLIYKQVRTAKTLQ